MNINTSKRTNCSKDYLNLSSSNYATNIVDVPTRVTTSSATVLDHIITNENVTDAFCNNSVKIGFLGCPSDSRLGPSPSVLFPPIEVAFQQIEVY